MIAMAILPISTFDPAEDRRGRCALRFLSRAPLQRASRKTLLSTEE
jgi:hypothetical protein